MSNSGLMIRSRLLRAAWRVGVVLGALMGCGLAGAQSMATLYQLGERPQRNTYAVCGIVSSSPVFQGTSHREMAVLPNFEARWTNGWFASVIYGVGYNAALDDSEYGVRLMVDLGRDANLTQNISGLGTIRPSLNPAVFANWAIEPWLKLMSGARTGMGVDGRGTTVDLGARIGLYLADNQLSGLALSVETQWANQAYNQSFFGITHDQSLRTDHPEFRPDAGLVENRLLLLGFAQFRPRWLATWRTGWTFPTIAVDDSPVVDHVRSFTASLVINYQWY